MKERIRGGTGTCRYGRSKVDFRLTGTVHQALPMVTVAELRARSVWHDQRSELDVDARAISLLDALVAARIDPSRMMPGTGCCSITETVELTAHAVKHACAGVLMLPPFYYKDVSEEGLYGYFSEVVQRVGGCASANLSLPYSPVAIVGITPKLVERLLNAYPKAIAGMKDSSGDWK